MCVAVYVSGDVTKIFKETKNQLHQVIMIWGKWQCRWKGLITRKYNSKDTYTNRWQNNTLYITNRKASISPVCKEWQVLYNTTSTQTRRQRGVTGVKPPPPQKRNHKFFRVYIWQRGINTTSFKPHNISTYILATQNFCRQWWRCLS